MHFKATWVDDDAVFNKLHDYQDEEPLFNLEIHEQEGQYPWARAVIKNPYCGLLHAKRQRRVFIMVKHNDETQLLFAGFIVGAPLRIDGETMEILLIAQPLNAAEQLKNLQRSLKGTSHWNELFVTPDKVDDINEALDAQSALPYWSRKDETVRLSNIFWGSQRFDLQQNFFRDRFNICMHKNILTAVNVNVKMEWTQRYNGRTNITYTLRRLFPGGLVNTFTGKSLQAKWWQGQQPIGHTQYWIKESSLKEIPAPHTGVLGIYPATSQSLMLSPHDPLNKTRKPLAVTLKRQWYRAKLILGWSYRQKRVEHVKFTLRHSVQQQQTMVNNNTKLERTLTISLQNKEFYNNSGYAWQAATLYKVGDKVTHSGQQFAARHSHLSGPKFSADKGQWVRHDVSRADNSSAHQASFFLSQRGEKAIEHAMEIARAHLAASARAVEIQIDAAFDRVMSLTCDHSVHIKDERLPGGQAWGKIKSLRLMVEGNSGKLWGSLVIGCSVGMTHDEQATTPQNQLSQYAYCRDDYCADDVVMIDSSRKKTLSTIGYQPYNDQVPQQGIIYPQHITASDLVENIMVINSPEEQEQALRVSQYPQSHNLKTLLQQNQTEIVLRLKDLRPHPQLVHTINLNVDSWSAPKQIDLAAAPRNFQ